MELTTEFSNKWWTKSSI